MYSFYSSNHSSFPSLPVSISPSPRLETSLCDSQFVTLFVKSP